MEKKIIFLLGIFVCISLVNSYNCKIEGCVEGFRCMANGECNPLTVKEYCEDHGKPFYTYDNSLLARNCSDILNLREEKLCQQCKADYELRKSTEDIENIIFSIVAGLGILMSVLGGIKLMTSQETEERENAKREIIYVILALIIIVITTKLVEYLLL